MQKENQVLDFFADAVAAWLRTMEPEILRDLARAGGSVIDRLEQFSSPAGKAVLRLILTPQRRKILERAGEREFGYILDRLLQTAPRHALILFAYPLWYRQQMAAVRDAIIRET